MQPDHVFYTKSKNVEIKTNFFLDHIVGTMNIEHEMNIWTFFWRDMGFGYFPTTADNGPVSKLFHKHSPQNQ